MYRVYITARKTKHKSTSNSVFTHSFGSSYRGKSWEDPVPERWGFVQKRYP